MCKFKVKESKQELQRMVIEDYDLEWFGKSEIRKWLF